MEKRESVRVSSEVLDMLREYLVRVYGGRIYGLIGRTVDEAIVEWVERGVDEGEYDN